MTIHINRTVSDIYPVDSEDDAANTETDERAKKIMELRRMIRQTEAEQVRVSAWEFDD